ncbi:MAG TPA: hypothetical protein VFO44_08875 [Steroidobacteraceae bacterium]|nr:hypothetical protein [Steroidobacteraceae bacterium]
MLLLLPLLFFRQVMADHATGRGPGNGMVTSDMAGDSTDDRAFDAALRHRSLRADEEREAEQRCRERWQLRLECTRHAVYLLRAL